jgi:hypothetical protein
MAGELNNENKTECGPNVMKDKSDFFSGPYFITDKSKFFSATELRFVTSSLSSPGSQKMHQTKTLLSKAAP